MLRFKHIVLIAVAAVLGVIGGYVLMSGRINSTNDETHRVAGTTDSTPSVPPVAMDVDGARKSVPDVRGQRLPDALAQLEAAGYRSVRVVDASPRNRVILDKDNWVVDSQDPVGGTAASSDVSIVLRAKKNTDDHTPQPADRGVVPDVVCAELQAAQDALRGSGFLLITSTDGTGQGRVAVLDRNWVVIGQSAAPGTSPGPTTHIVLTIVKHGESTGSSGCKS